MNKVRTMQNRTFGYRVLQCNMGNSGWPLFVHVIIPKLVLLNSAKGLGCAFKFSTGMSNLSLRLDSLPLPSRHTQVI
jgi:hypothetical protein